MRVKVKVAQDFLELQEKLPDIMKAYNLSGSFVAQEAKIKKTTFFDKLKKQSFTAKEMIAICTAINQ